MNKQLSFLFYSPCATKHKLLMMKHETTVSRRYTRQYVFDIRKVSWIFICHLADERLNIIPKNIPLLYSGWSGTRARTPLAWPRDLFRTAYPRQIWTDGKLNPFFKERHRLSLICRITEETISTRVTWDHSYGRMWNKCCVSSSF